MDKEVAERFRAQLKQKQEEILSEVGKTLSEMNDQTTNIPDPNDRATVESGRSFELRIRDRERKLLSKIEDAINRIDEGEFGICEDCGEDIGLKRLEARPVTTFCIDCKTLQETSEPVELDQTRVGRLSRMDAMQSQQMALETVRRRKETLVKIEGALHRIESGDYGFCFVCSEEIDIRRVLADPTSTRCMECVE